MSVTHCRWDKKHLTSLHSTFLSAQPSTHIYTRIVAVYVCSITLHTLPSLDIIAHWSWAEYRITSGPVSMGPHVGVGARIPRNEVFGEKMVRGKLAQVGGVWKHTSIKTLLFVGVYWQARAFSMTLYSKLQLGITTIWHVVIIAQCLRTHRQFQMTLCLVCERLASWCTGLLWRGSGSYTLAYDLSQLNDIVRVECKYLHSGWCHLGLWCPEEERRSLQPMFSRPNNEVNAQTMPYVLLPFYTIYHTLSQCTPCDNCS